MPWCYNRFIKLESLTHIPLFTDSTADACNYLLYMKSGRQIREKHIWQVKNRMDPVPVHPVSTRHVVKSSPLKKDHFCHLTNTTMSICLQTVFISHSKNHHSLVFIIKQKDKEHPVAQSH